MAETAAKDVQLHISDEQVLIDIAPGVAGVSAEFLCQKLQGAGIRHGILKQALIDASSAYQKNHAIKDFVVAKCTPPTSSKPGRLERLIQVGQIAAPGDLIAEVIPGEAGEHGTSVRGDLIEAPTSAPVKLSAGDNTEVDYGKLKSLAYGVVKFKDNLISVVPPLQVAFDKLSVAIDIHPTSQSGTQVTKDHIIATLTKFDIHFGIDADAIDVALQEAAATNVAVFRVEVAKGIPAVAAKMVDYEFAFTLSGADPKQLLQADKQSAELAEPLLLDLVDEDDVLCKVSPPTPAKPGKNVYGQEIKSPPADSTKLPTLSCGDNVVLDGATQCFKSAIFRSGYAYLDGSKICVKSPIEVSQDQMTAFLTLYPPGKNKKTLPKKDILEILSGTGVKYGVAESKIDEVLAHCLEQKTPQLNIPIAQGREEKKGKDAYLEFLISVEQKAGKERADGSIDFRERGTIVNVKAGDAICKRIPPEPGQSQVTVTGETFPASAGADIQFTEGENVELKGDTFYALQHGALMLRDNAVHVSDIYEHKGDINLNSGNLNQSKGSIHITGSITSGFEVKANGHVSVNEMVDNGRVIAGGDVFVKGGVIQSESSDGYIRSMGSVEARFLQNAKIFSYKNVTVNDYAMNASIHAKGSVIVTKGKGLIVGGVTKSSHSISARQIGSDAGAVTLVEIEYDPKVVKTLLKAIEEKTALVESGEAEQGELDELIRQQKEFYKKCQDEAEIRIEGVVYPGVTIKILGVATEIFEEKRFCKITLNPKKAMLFSPLK